MNLNLLRKYIRVLLESGQDRTKQSNKNPINNNLDTENSKKNMIVGALSMEKNIIAAVAVYSLVFLFVFSSDSKKYEVFSESNVEKALNANEPLKNDEEYFDCLADNPVECKTVKLEENGCHAWKTCSDGCIAELQGSSCYVNCNIDHLGQEQSLHEEFCGCEFCSSSCTNFCNCGDLVKNN